MPQPKYYQALDQIKKVNSIKAEEIDTYVSQWRIDSVVGMRIVDNLKRDYKIDLNHMINILECLHSNMHLEYKEFETKIYKIECRNYKLKGEEIDKNKVGQKVGNAKTVTDFIWDLCARIKSIKKKRALKLVSKLRTGMIKLTPKEDDIDVARFSSWITWSEVSPSEPFDFVNSPHEIIKVTANLGLSHRQQGESHLLFIYDKKVISSIKYPTIADAELYTYFNCADYDDYCGRTEPWKPPDYELHGLIREDVKPRAEGVHEPIKLVDIDKPVHTAI